MRFPGILAAFAVAFLSCEPPKSKNPLSDPKTATAEPRLAGTWGGRVGGDAEVTLSVYPREGALFDVILLGSDGAKGAVVLAFEGFPSVLGARKYWNLRSKKWAGEYGEHPTVSDSYIFVRYELPKDGSLVLWQMDDAPAVAAVKAGILEGSVLEKDSVLLSAESEKLVAFLATPEGEKSFKPFGTFKRLSRASAKPAAVK
jgi:hypothetical protein